MADKMMRASRSKREQKKKQPGNRDGAPGLAVTASDNGFRIPGCLIANSTTRYVYIIQSELDGSFYKGFTTDYLKRLAAHTAGLSTYTSRKIPWKLMYVEELPS